MIRKIARAAVLPALFWIAACSSSSSSAHPAAETGFPVEGSAGDLRKMTGRWEGDYSSPVTGRTGSNSVPAFLTDATIRSATTRASRGPVSGRSATISSPPARAATSS